LREKQERRGREEKGKMPSATSALPIIDISSYLPSNASSCTDADRAETAKALYSACHEVGFFYLTNHGVPQEVLDDVLDAARDFFVNASEKEKLDIARKEVEDGGDGARGWQMLGMRTFRRWCSLTDGL
jgi:isopenicillin N synthase-like dioxygenase